MSDYHNDFTCSMYDFYMLTGEGAEYFEDTTEEDYYQEECQEECQKEMVAILMVLVVDM